MASSVNKVILLGNLGKDAELSFLPSGQPVSKFTIATNRRYKDRNGDMQEEVEWHNIVLWGKAAEALSQYLTKGRKVYVEGRIKSRTWEGKDGNKHYATDIVADRVVFAGGREEGAPPARSSQGHARTAAAPASPNAPPPAATHSDEGLSPEITDEDIPF